jgi:SAM-dependent methyltransferase
MYIEIGDLPVWKGVQDKPGYEKKRFIFSVDKGLIRLKLPTEEISKISQCYSDEDYNFITSPPGSSDWGNRLGNFYFKILSEWTGNISGKSVLEIGSGTLYIAHRTVNELHAGHFTACDPVLDALSITKKIVVAKNYFSFKLFENDYQKIDLIISINNLEHIPDIGQYLNDVHQLLNPDSGRFFVVVPDCSRGFKNGDLGICVHEHMTYFTPQTLVSTFLSSGFSIEKIVSIEDTLFVLAKPENKQTPPCDYEHQSIEMVQRYGQLVTSNLRYFENLLNDTKPRGSTALHGCCVGLNNTLALLGIHDDPDIFLFDGDIEKKGKYLPAFNQPIYSSNDITYRKMKTVIIAALTYYDEIKQDIRLSHNIHSDSIFPIIPVT